MSDEQKSFCGCLVFIATALLIGVGLRSQNLTQFLVMGVETVVAILALLWGLNSLSEDGCLNKLWGLLCGFCCLVLIVSVGNFLITGNYERSIKIAKLEWGQATPTPATLTQSDVTPTVTPPQPTVTPTSTSTSTPQPTPAAMTTPTPVSVPLTTSSGAGDWSWLSEAEPPHERVTGVLNKIWGLSAPDATQEADRLRVSRGMASAEGQWAVGLLIAAALEHGGDLNSARVAYAEVADKAKDTPYAASAAFRLRFLEKRESSPKEKEILYNTVVAEPEAKVWFMLSGSWVWDTTRRAARQSLVDLRADQLSFRFFQFLRLQSPFPVPYAYMFILLALTIGVKILTLPLYTRAAKSAVQIRRLSPEIQMIQSVYSSDPLAMNQRLMELYKERGVNMFGGCAVLIVDPIFVIWMLIAMSSFSPQLVLDGAKFFWVSDVTQRNFGILLAWTVLSFIQYAITSASQQMGQQLGQSLAMVSCSALITSAVIIGIAWNWNWPAYVFIFWMLLSILGILINGVLTGIAAATE